MSARHLTLSRPSTATRLNDGFSHVMTCHDPDLGLCGADLSGLPVNEDADTDCIVCAELDELDCDRGDGFCGCLCCEESLTEGGLR